MRNPGVEFANKFRLRDPSKAVPVRRVSRSGHVGNYLHPTSFFLRRRPEASSQNGSPESGVQNRGVRRLSSPQQTEVEVPARSRLRQRQLRQRRRKDLLATPLGPL